MNSQLPHNNLSRISNIRMVPEKILEAALNLCIRALFRLDGYLEAVSPFEAGNDIRLLHIAETRHAFDLEGYSISFTRLFEAYSSGATNKESIQEGIFAYIEYFRQLKNPGIAELKPSYAGALRKGRELLREKKEYGIRSYFTNLTLYTAPSQPEVLEQLKRELDLSMKRQTTANDLLHMCICHFQIRVLAPYLVFNDHVACTYTKLFLKGMGLGYDVLPIANCIAQQKETHRLIIREVTQTGDYNRWCLYYLQILEKSANLMLEKLKSLATLKRKVLSQILKYTGYNLPGEELVKVLFFRPYIKPADLVSALNCHRHTAYTYMQHLEKIGILVKKIVGREKLYLHKELLDLLSN